MEIPSPSGKCPDYTHVRILFVSKPTYNRSPHRQKESSPTILNKPPTYTTSSSLHRTFHSARHTSTFSRIYPLVDRYRESICSELTIANWKRICLNIYKPPNPNNMNACFDEIMACLIKVALKYDNIIIMGDFNIDIKR